MDNAQALQGYFNRVLPLLPELYNIAYAITGSAELAEYALEAALMEGWSGGVRKGAGFRESMKSAVKRIAISETSKQKNVRDLDWDAICDNPQTPLLKRLTLQEIALQRVAALRFGCELKPRMLSKITGMTRGQISEALGRIQSVAAQGASSTRPEAALGREIRKAFARSRADMPPAETIFRAFQAEATTVRVSNHWFSHTVSRVILALLVLIAAVVFWLTAVLIQPDGGAMLEGPNAIETGTGE